MTRQADIRSQLRHQYSLGAANEKLVARLRFEMTRLPHQHKWLDDFASKGERECAYCFMGTDAFFMSLEDILAEID